MKPVTVLLIPAPAGGRAYRWWYRAYRLMRQARHLLGMHDWNRDATRCTWCGKAWNA